MLSEGRLQWRRLSARRVAFTHECADPGRSNPGQQDRQENYRSCGSSRHFGKLYLRLYEMRKLGDWFHDPLLSTIRLWKNSQ